VGQSSSSSFYNKILYVGGSGPDNYTKIQYAIDNASDGYTVFVFNGTYYENIQIDKSIDLIGEDINGTIVNCRFDAGIQVLTDYVVVCGFKITNSDSYGVELHYSNNSKICGNNISTGPFFGISLFHSEGNEIYSNTIHNYCEEGINLSYSNQNNIHHNIISNQGHGIRLHRSDNNKICYNEIFNHVKHPYEYFTSGILIENSDSVDITHNNIHDNQFGVVCRNSDKNEILYNNFLNNKPCDINLYDSFSNTISYNNLLANKITFMIHIPRRPIIYSPTNWNYNYWGEPRNFPKPISGYISIFRWIKFDWHPAQEQFDI
jgi:parallel beta-helix repeat protein